MHTAIKKLLALMMAMLLLTMLLPAVFADEADESTEVETDAVLYAADEEATEAPADEPAPADDTAEENKGENDPADGDTTTVGAIAEDGTEDAAAEESESSDKGSGAVNTLKIIVLILDAICAVVLIVVVLFQSGKSAGLSGAIAGNSDSFVSKTGSKTLDAKLARSTKWIGLVFVFLTLASVILVMIASRG